MDPKTFYKCNGCMGHYLGPYKAENCHRSGYIEVYACTDCATLYFNYEEAVKCCVKEVDHKEEDLKY